jgi:hypothetical protein
MGWRRSSRDASPNLDLRMKPTYKRGEVVSGAASQQVWCRPIVLWITALLMAVLLAACGSGGGGGSGGSGPGGSGPGEGTRRPIPEGGAVITTALSTSSTSSTTTVPPSEPSTPPTSAG